MEVPQSELDSFIKQRIPDVYTTGIVNEFILDNTTIEVKEVTEQV